MPSSQEIRAESLRRMKSPFYILGFLCAIGGLICLKTVEHEIWPVLVVFAGIALVSVGAIREARQKEWQRAVEAPDGSAPAEAAGFEAVAASLQWSPEALDVAARRKAKIIGGVTAAATTALIAGPSAFLLIRSAETWGLEASSANYVGLGFMGVWFAAAILLSPALLVGRIRRRLATYVPCVGLVTKARVASIRGKRDPYIVVRYEFGNEVMERQFSGDDACAGEGKYVVLWVDPGNPLASVIVCRAPSEVVPEARPLWADAGVKVRQSLWMRIDFPFALFTVAAGLGLAAFVAWLLRSDILWISILITLGCLFLLAAGWAYVTVQLDESRRK